MSDPSSAAQGLRAFDAFVAPARARPALWRIVLGMATLAVVYALLNGAALAAVWALAGPQEADLWAGRLAAASTPRAALVLLATFLPLIAGVWLAAWLWHGRGARSLFGPWRRGARDAARGAGVTALCFAPSLAVWSFGHDSVANLPLGLWLAILPLSLCLIGVQTLAEELLFRGYLQPQLAARFARPLIWGGVPALSFALLHFDPDRLGNAAPVAVAAALLFGVMAADLTARSGGIGMAWGVHWANNTLALALLATQGTLTGLALRVTPYAAGDLANAPLLLLGDALPILASWLVLRRLTRP